MRIKVNDRVILKSVKENTGPHSQYNYSDIQIHGGYPDYDKTTATVLEIFEPTVLLRIEGHPEEGYINNPLYIPNTLVLWYNKSSIDRVLTNKVIYEESL